MRIACLALLAILPAAAEPIISFDFEDATLLKPPAKQVAAPGGHALQVDNADPGGSATVLFELPADQLAGRRVTLTAKVKADGVSTPPNPWNGVKVMLVVETAGGKQQHPNCRCRSAPTTGRPANEPCGCPRRPPACSFTSAGAVRRHSDLRRCQPQPLAAPGRRATARNEVHRPQLGPAPGRDAWAEVQ